MNSQVVPSGSRADRLSRFAPAPTTSRGSRTASDPFDTQLARACRSSAREAASGPGTGAPSDPASELSSEGVGPGAGPGEGTVAAEAGSDAASLLLWTAGLSTTPEGGVSAEPSETGAGDGAGTGGEVGGDPTAEGAGDETEGAGAPAGTPGDEAGGAESPAAGENPVGPMASEARKEGREGAASALRGGTGAGARPGPGAGLDGVAPEGGDRKGPEDSAGGPGIGSAEGVETMYRPEPMIETAAGFRHELPDAAGGNADSVPAGADGLSGADAARLALAGGRYADAEGVSAAGMGSAAEISAAGESAAAAVEATDRLAALVESAVARFHRTGSGGYEVELRPDGSTELLLRVRWVDGSAEVEAELRRGDAEAFAGRWTELRERLADQGVRLSDWKTGGGGGGWGATGDDRRGEERGRAGAGRDEILDGVNPGRPPGRRTGTRTMAAGLAKGWETWA